jgi:hypothetical protein
MIKNQKGKVPGIIDLNAIVESMSTGFRET